MEREELKANFLVTEKGDTPFVPSEKVFMPMEKGRCWRKTLLRWLPSFSLSLRRK